MDYQDSIKSHYKSNWQIEPNICYWDKGPANELPYDFRILEFPPTKEICGHILLAVCRNKKMVKV